MPSDFSSTAETRPVPASNGHNMDTEAPDGSTAGASLVSRIGPIEHEM